MLAKHSCFSAGFRVEPSSCDMSRVLTFTNGIPASENGSSSRRIEAGVASTTPMRKVADNASAVRKINDVLPAPGAAMRLTPKMPARLSIARFCSEKCCLALQHSIPTAALSESIFLSSIECRPELHVPSRVIPISGAIDGHSISLSRKPSRFLAGLPCRNDGFWWVFPSG